MTDRYQLTGCTCGKITCPNGVIFDTLNNTEVAGNLTHEQCMLVADLLNRQATTATHGDLSSNEHTAFMLRALMYLTHKSPGSTLVLDLNKVAEHTNEQMVLQCALDGPQMTLYTMVADNTGMEH